MARNKSDAQPSKIPSDLFYSATNEFLGKVKPTTWQSPDLRHFSAQDDQGKSRNFFVDDYGLVFEGLDAQGARSTGFFYDDNSSELLQCTVESRKEDVGHNGVRNTVQQQVIKRPGTNDDLYCDIDGTVSIFAITDAKTQYVAPESLIVGDSIYKNATATNATGSQIRSDLDDPSNINMVYADLCGRHNVPGAPSESRTDTMDLRGVTTSHVSDGDPEDPIYSEPVNPNSVDSNFYSSVYDSIVSANQQRGSSKTLWAQYEEKKKGILNIQPTSAIAGNDQTASFSGPGNIYAKTGPITPSSDPDYNAQNASIYSEVNKKLKGPEISKRSHKSPSFTRSSQVGVAPTVTQSGQTYASLSDPEHANYRALRTQSWVQSPLSRQGQADDFRPRQNSVVDRAEYGHEEVQGDFTRTAGMLLKDLAYQLQRREGFKEALKSSTLSKSHPRKGVAKSTQKIDSLLQEIITCNDLNAGSIEETFRDLSTLQGKKYGVDQGFIEKGRYGSRRFEDVQGDTHNDHILSQEECRKSAIALYSELEEISKNPGNYQNGQDLKAKIGESLATEAAIKCNPNGNYPQKLLKAASDTISKCSKDQEYSIAFYPRKVTASGSLSFEIPPSQIGKINEKCPGLNLKEPKKGQGLAIVIHQNSSGEVKSAIFCQLKVKKAKAPNEKDRYSVKYSKKLNLKATEEYQKGHKFASDQELMDRGIVPQSMLQAMAEITEESIRAMDQQRVPIQGTGPDPEPQYQDPQDAVSLSPQLSSGSRFDATSQDPLIKPENTSLYSTPQFNAGATKRPQVKKQVPGPLYSTPNKPRRGPQPPSEELLHSQRTALTRSNKAAKGPKEPYATKDRSPQPSFESLYDTVSSASAEVRSQEDLESLDEVKKFIREVRRRKAKTPSSTPSQAAAKSMQPNQFQTQGASSGGKG